MGIHQEQAREDYQTDLMYEDIKLDPTTKRGKEFRAKQSTLTEKLRSLPTFNKEVEVVEVRNNPKKPYSAKYRRLSGQLKMEGRKTL